MAYTRKTRDEYDIQQDWGGGWETVHTEETYKEARARLREYHQAQLPIPCRIKKTRVKIETAA